VPPIVPSKPIDADLDVTGTIDRPPGIAIYDVWVAGVAATGTGLDFNAFSAKVPYSRLSSLASASGQTDNPTATIEITARTNCNAATVALTSFSVPVNLKPGVTLDRLAFDPPLIPNNAGYLPADGSASAILRLRANAAAAGATVTLTTSAGTFDGVGAGNTVTLSGDGKSDALAACAFKSSSDAQISASAKGLSAATAITVAGAPTLVPSSATLAPGESVTVTVFTDGKVKSCQATPAPGVSVMSGGTNLMATPGGKDETGDGRIDITITAPDKLATPVSTTGSCTDLFGQFTTATYTAKPPAP
jgi:hypothetical protein